jgi:hypothetical protein
MLVLALLALAVAPLPDGLSKQLNKSCAPCHTGKSAQAGLDLSTLSQDLAHKPTREKWIRIHDRVQKNEMPPKAAPPLDPQAKATILAPLAKQLHQADAAEVAQHGPHSWHRGPMRRLNRDEYEQNLRALLRLPFLDIRDMLPEDREAHHFTKVSESLDISRVQLAAYLDASEAALRQAIAATNAAPAITKFRAPGLKLFPGLRSTGGRESMFFIKNNQGINVEKENPRPLPPEVQADESIEMGLFRSPAWPYGAFPRGFAAPHRGEYIVRFAARAVLQQPGFKVTDPVDPNFSVPLTLRSRRPTNHDIAEDVKSVGGILDIKPGRNVYQTKVYLTQGQTIEWGLLGLPVPQPDALKGISGSYRFPPLPKDGQPGIAFHWLEIEGPIAPAAWPPPSHQVLFDQLGINPHPADPKAESKRLLRRFLQQASRSPVPEEAAQKFEALVAARLAQKEPFVEAMIAGYQAILCSGLFLYLPEPSKQNSHALAERLSHFLENGPPDAQLRQQAAHLHNPKILRQQTQRLIAGAGFERFVTAFTASWLNLKKLRRDDPDIRLYPEYRLDEYLVDSLERETQLFFTALFRENLPAKALVDSDFTFLNDRLARHYNLPPIIGSAMRRTPLPKESHLGGFLTQGAILKVTANGTSTSPVIRGAWIMDRILGDPPPPPPPGVPAVEPDLRGAKTIRDQLALHTKSATCASCHANFDPVGLALENFDVLGRYRTRYRGTSEGEMISGIDTAGHDFAYTLASPIDSSGKLADGRSFRDVRELKALLAANPRQLAKNLLQQFTVYATGTPVRFSDRAEIEKLLDAAAPNNYRIADLLESFIQSKIFTANLTGAH